MMLPHDPLIEEIIQKIEELVKKHPRGRHSYMVKDLRDPDGGKIIEGRYSFKIDDDQS